MNVPIYVLQRDPRNFAPVPDEFWPDRWLRAAQSNSDAEDTDKGEEPGSAHNLTAFIPFSSGPAHCAGKNLALAEMRVVITSLIHQFEIRLEDSFDARKDFEGDLQDVFLFKVGRLPVTLKPRI